MTNERLAGLTGQERACLRGFWKHGSVAGIAVEQGKSISTIEKHLHAARRKLGVNRSIDGARLVAMSEGLDVYGPPSRRLTAGDYPAIDVPFLMGADHRAGASMVQDAAAFRPWLAYGPAVDETVGPAPFRVALTLGERAAVIGRRAMGTVGGFATLLLIAYVLQRLARGE